MYILQMIASEDIGRQILTYGERYDLGLDHLLNWCLKHILTAKYMLILLCYLGLTNRVLALK